MWEEQRSIGEAERKFVLYKIKPPKLQSHQTQSVVSKFDGEQYYDDGSGYWKFSAFRLKKMFGKTCNINRRHRRPAAPATPATCSSTGDTGDLQHRPFSISDQIMDENHTTIVDCETSLKMKKPKFGWDNRSFMVFVDSCLIEQKKGHKPGTSFDKFVQEFFNHSGETIHRHFHIVLKVVLKLSADIIKPDANYNDDVPEYILNKPRYYPMFKDCIGAIDGTHGTAHDTRIFNEALQRPDLNFPYSTGDKYYVVDAGYPNTRGWELLRDMHVNYKYKNQVRIVIASMVIHNYIRKFGMSDEAFNRAQQESYNPVRGDTGSDVYEEGPTLISWNESRRQWIGDQSQRSPTERMPEDPVKRSKEHLILFIQEVLESIPLTAEVKLSDDAYEILILKF
ncbi:unnamed protein product [Lactuca virosa]|uniref:DDE Tnp4 domain-containing protein n=1 Tax=Lactuca virosa TaxID=75947 RepID=A0AAU9P4Y3_9ASTR|nr:unnamed protein product [Lactuca virosa]